MARKRPYNLACPIARALDVLGDRWTLLILRDLHAGPARFGELERGLGMASNLLTHRLGELSENHLIERVENDGAVRYGLTELGRASDRVLWELTRFGAALPISADPDPPGNVRTVALPLRILLSGVDSPPAMTVRLMIDGQAIVVTSDDQGVAVVYGRGNEPAGLVLHTDYESFLAVGEGRMDPTVFVSDHLEISEGHDLMPFFMQWFAAALMIET